MNPKILNFGMARIISGGNDGYVSPEYALEGVFSIISDIFSFGLIFIYFFVYALLCAQKSADDRPTVYDVVSMLTNEATTLNPPNQPGFSYVRTFQHRPPGRQKIVQ
ncbi:hypothetical protein KPL70_021018 [Citrus sinensis]|uniref:Protein kinase domain-containing protein n=1 Tax=Citrus clementina TaxID=85681 RepID=V4SJK6_CITCL|nr:hypothetical protein CICLE_v10027471mg [Citrus x clementina]KAH9667385.1 hypothetical protein KPL70_021018 [Citrus sinensis]